MNADEMERLVSRLEALTELSRAVDGHIAVLVGFEKRTVDGRTAWVLPTGESGTVPNYTGNMDDAFGLAKMVAPHAAVGCTWHDGYGRAVIEGSEQVQAATPAIALCVAALRFKQRSA